MSSDHTIARYSSQLRIEQLGTETVFRKKYVEDDWGGNHEVVRKRAHREYRLIEQLATSGEFRRRLGVVRVADASPSKGEIATYQVPGRSLEQWIHQKTKLDSMLPWFLAGRWLRTFQSLSLPKEANERFTDEDQGAIADYCDVRLSSLSDYNYGWPGLTLKQKIYDTLSKLETCDGRTVWVHADYAPGNLMWGNGVFTPIDFAMARAGNGLEDATYLIHRLEMAKIYRPWIKLPVADCRRAILRGLGRSDAVNSPQYQALMIKHLICRLHTYVRRPAKSCKQAIHDYWVRNVIRRKLLKTVDSV